MGMAEKEYIEREAAINAVFEAFADGRSAYIALEALPAADVRPVVTCADCKHSDTFAPDCTEATFPLKCLSIRYGGVYPDWFCEHGVKREES